MREVAVPTPRRIYRLLVNLHPARFREEYGAQLERQFWDEYREERSRRGHILFWLQALGDLAISIPVQFAHEVRQDICFAARVYRKRRLVTALALAALALSIGVTTGVFSVLNSLLLRGLPFRDADSLVVWRNPPVDAFEGRPVFEEWRNRSAYLRRPRRRERRR